MQKITISLARLLVEITDMTKTNDKANNKLLAVLRLLDELQLSNSSKRDEEWITFVGDSLSELSQAEDDEELEKGFDDLYGSLATLKALRCDNLMTMIVIVEEDKVGFQIDQDGTGKIINLGYRNLAYGFRKIS
jgi:hypothetical protein